MLMMMRVWTEAADAGEACRGSCYVLFFFCPTARKKVEAVDADHACLSLLSLRKNPRQLRLMMRAVVLPFGLVLIMRAVAPPHSSAHNACYGWCHCDTRNGLCS